MTVAEMVRRKMNTTSTTSPTASTSVNCTSRIEARIVSVRSCTTSSLAPTGKMRRSRGSSCWMFSHRLHHVGAGLAADIDDDGLLAVVPAGDLGVLQPVDDLGDVAQHHRIAVAIGDDQRAIGFRRGELVVRRDGVGLERAVECALRPGDVGVDDRLADVLERESIGGEPRQVDLDAHRAA